MRWASAIAIAVVLAPEVLTLIRRSESLRWRLRWVTGPSARKWVASFVKSDWRFEDYPVRLTQVDTHTKSYWAAQLEGAFLSGTGISPEAAKDALAANFAGYRQRHPLMPRPGTIWPIEFASTDRVEQCIDIARDFLAKILGWNFDESFVSDESTLADFHCEDSNEPHLQRIAETYGLDVSDIVDGPLVGIFERIAGANRQQ